MAHPAQRYFLSKLKELHPQIFDNVSVIDMGSLDINGTVKDFFSATKFVGVDVMEGPGVDLVCETQKVDFPDNSFDVAISAECFEHNPYWAETFENMWRMASKYIIFTCAGEGRPEHGTTKTDGALTPWEYYGNLAPENFQKFPLDEMFDVYQFIANPNVADLYFWGVKKGAANTLLFL